MVRVLRRVRSGMFEAAYDGGAPTHLEAFRHKDDIRRINIAPFTIAQFSVLVKANLTFDFFFPLRP